MENIQDLLDLYKERKNAQGGVIQYSMLKALAVTEDGTSVQIEGTHNGQGFTAEERNILAGNLFRGLDVMKDGDAAFVRSSVRRITDHLVNRIDVVTIEPQTEHLQTVLKKLGVFCDAHENVPAVFPYPYRGRSLRQFENVGGTYMYQSDFDDRSMPEKGVVIRLPSSYSHESDVKDVDIAVLTLHRMGLRLPLDEYVFEHMEKKLRESKRSLLFAWTIGHDFAASSLVAYDQRYAPSAIHIAVLDEPALVAERLAFYANQITPESENRADGRPKLTVVS